MTRTAGLPSGQPHRARILNRIFDVHTSPRRTAAPVARLYPTINGLYCSATLIWSLELIVQAVFASAPDPWENSRWRSRAHCAPNPSQFPAYSASGIHFHAHCRQRGLPPTNTCPTPLTCASFCARMVSPHRTFAGTVIVSEVSDKNQDRSIRRIHLSISRDLPEDWPELAARRIDCCLDISRSSIDVSVQIELQRDAGCAGLARRSHLIDAGNATELAL